MSINPETDGTAIWLEHKFDAPASGQWESDVVFSIPLRQKDTNLSSSPGVIVFECTPLDRASDELERSLLFFCLNIVVGSHSTCLNHRKFRILDDCGRFRDIIRSLPQKRHYIPSLLVLCWADGERNELPSDFLIMVRKMVSSTA